jgi:hypothetical protein
MVSPQTDGTIALRVGLMPMIFFTDSHMTTPRGDA